MRDQKASSRYRDTSLRDSPYDAILRNQLHLVGDKHVGTAYPLEFVMHHDPSVPSTLGPKGEDGKRGAQFALGFDESTS